MVGRLRHCRPIPGPDKGIFFAIVLAAYSPSEHSVCSRSPSLADGGCPAKATRPVDRRPTGSPVAPPCTSPAAPGSRWRAAGRGLPGRRVIDARENSTDGASRRPRQVRRPRSEPRASPDTQVSPGRDSHHLVRASLVRRHQPCQEADRKRLGPVVTHLELHPACRPLPVPVWTQRRSSVLQRQGWPAATATCGPPCPSWSAAQDGHVHPQGVGEGVSP